MRAGSSAPTSGDGGRAPISWKDFARKAAIVFVSVLYAALLVLSYKVLWWIPVFGKILWVGHALYLFYPVFFE